MPLSLGRISCGASFFDKRRAAGTQKFRSEWKRRETWYEKHDACHQSDFYVVRCKRGARISRRWNCTAAIPGRAETFTGGMRPRPLTSTSGSASSRILAVTRARRVWEMFSRSDNARTHLSFRPARLVPQAQARAAFCLCSLWRLAAQNHGDVFRADRHGFRHWIYDGAGRRSGHQGQSPSGCTRFSIGLPAPDLLRRGQTIVEGSPSGSSCASAINDFLFTLPKPSPPRTTEWL